MQLKEKEEDKNEKPIGKLIRKSPLIKGVCQFNLSVVMKIISTKSLNLLF